MFHFQLQIRRIFLKQSFFPLVFGLGTKDKSSFFRKLGINRFEELINVGDIIYLFQVNNTVQIVLRILRKCLFLIVPQTGKYQCP